MPKTTAVDLLRRATDNEELIEKTKKKIAGRQLMRRLTIERMRSGLSQSDVADRMGCSQTKVSKMENGIDDDLRLGDLGDYLDAFGLHMRLIISPHAPTYVDQIKQHAFLIKRAMDNLCELAHQDEDIAEGVSDFICKEALYNFLRMIVGVAKRLPVDSLDDETRAALQSEYEIFSEEDESSLDGNCEHCKPAGFSE
ncbi:MAG: helix-turn-helix domain-containing protein [Planctomycetota bacterium]